MSANESTHLENELAEVLRFFGIGQLAKYRRAGGFANENYFVSTKSGEYVVKLLRERSADDAKSEIPYLERVVEHGFPAVPYLIRGGQCVFEREGLAAVAMEKIEGKPSDRTVSNCISMASALAELHSIPCNELESRSSFLSGQFIDQSIAKLEHLVPVEDLQPYIEARERLASFEASLEVKERRIIHCDFTPNNCLFRDDLLVGVIDWEEVTLGYPLLDIANLVLSSCFVGTKFDRETFKEIAETYLKSRQVEALYLEHLSVAVRLAGLSFSLWVYLRWGIGSDDSFVANSRQLYWRNELEDLDLTI